MRTLILLAALAIPSICVGQSDVSESSIANYRESALARWDQEIKKLEALDQTDSDPEGALLLIGSSSIRLWETAVEDLKPFPIIRRGYGGAKFTDMAVFAKRLITPHKFDGMVVFVANDVQGQESDTSISELNKLVRYIVEVGRSHQPDAQIFLVEITPTRRRYDAWPQIRKANALLREIALTESNTHFIPTAEYYLDNEGQPREEYFRGDKLHLNREGYVRWGNIIRNRIVSLTTTD